MAVGKFMKSGGMAALAAGLALLVLPAGAQAQDRGHGRWGGGDGAAQSGGGRWQGNGSGGSWQGNGGNGGGHSFRGGQSTPTPTPAPAPQVQAQPQHNWSRGDGNGGSWRGQNNGAGGNRWRGRGEGQVQTQPVPAPQAQVERRNWAGNGGNNQWQGRNRSYVDPNRNGLYRAPDNNRNDSARWRNDRNGRNDSWRGNNWSSNNGNRWQGSRQGYAGSWNRDWRRDGRYDWQRYRSANRNIYRLDPYYAPYRGYSYRRLGIGYQLDSLFFGSDYWIDDPWSYRLPPADGPYRWVRYYDDALLVDTYSGEVVDVIYDFFW